MNELIDVNKKQLEGVYNLPTDASFFVPFQGYELGLGDGAGGLGGAATDLSGAATELDQAAREIMDAALALATDIYDPTLPIISEEAEIFKPGALIGGEKYLEEYDIIGKQLARIAGEKYPEEYGPTVRGERPALIGGEKYLEEYATTESASIDKFGQSVDSFNQGVDSQMTFFDYLLSLLGIGETTTQKQQIPEPPKEQPTPFGGLLFPQLITGGLTEFAPDFGNILDLLSQKISNLSGFSTNLKIASTTTTNLIVDGRLLAEVVKPYLYSDMIRFEDSATSVTKNIVV
jgi:hypothetical protein